MGGIVCAADAVEFMLAGATAVQVGTASYADPRAVQNIATGLRRRRVPRTRCRGSAS